MSSNQVCRAARDALSARQDGELEHEDADLLARHLPSCEPCRAHALLLARLAPRLAPLRAAAAPPADLWARLERRLPAARAPHRPPAPVLARAAAALLGFAGASALALAREHPPAAAPEKAHALERLFAGPPAVETLASLPELRLLRHP